MTDAAYGVPLELHLRYAHALGARSPYFAGLARGVACARRCAGCGRTWFPPRATCTCGGSEFDWIQLSGRGVVVAVTRGRATLPGATASGEFAFALVRMEGAANCAFGRLASGAWHLAQGDEVQLASARGAWPHPSQAFEFVSATGASAGQS